MDIKSLSNFDLEKILKNKVVAERQITVEIISLLEEVSARRIYLQRGFGSLIEYCIKELNYSESSAYRRISAMRVAKELPQVKEAIAAGKLNLVNVARAQTHFQKEAQNKKALTCFEKSKVLETLENQSSRQAEKILLQLSPQPSLPKEKIREVSPTHTQVSLVFSEELMQKLSELKHLLSHKSPNPSTTELIELLADMALKNLKPRNPVQEQSIATKMQCATSAGVTDRKTDKDRNETKKIKQPNNRVYIPINLKRKVWQRAQGQCQYQDTQSKRRCESKFQLQHEHKQPVAKGGENSEENLELLCAAHNRLRAIEQYGKSHMQIFLNN